MVDDAALLAEMLEAWKKLAPNMPFSAFRVAAEWGTARAVPAPAVSSLDERLRTAARTTIDAYYGYADGLSERMTRVVEELRAVLGEVEAAMGEVKEINNAQ